MNKLDFKLQEIKKRGTIGIMTHVVIGYPTLEDIIPLVKAMVIAGADIVELQIPFSDPLADGSTIMKACEESLLQGTKVADAFDIARKLSGSISIPFLFMCYYNTMFKYGIEKFIRDAKSAGITGLIVPDIPLDEEKYEHFIKFCRKFNIHGIRVISPATTLERLEKNAKVASGFVYFTSRQGSTGASSKLDPGISSKLEKVKKIIKIPIAIGFGISKKEHIKSLQNHADIAVVGSAIIDVINKSDKKTMLNSVSNFIRYLKEK
jgi:tryptophan synthase alpha chain